MIKATLKKHVMNNILAQFTALTLLVSLASSAAMGYLISTQNAQETIKTHINIFPEVVRQRAADKPEIYTFFKAASGTVPSGEVEAFLNDLKSFGNIFRIKVWRNDGTILWSDKKEIIGKNYYDNVHFLRAMSGDISYEVARPSKAENISEKGSGVVLEIYTPVWEGDRIAGVVELYEKAEDLFGIISVHNRFVWQSVFGIGLTVYALLFYIFYRAHKRQELANERIRLTQDAIIYALAYQASLRDVETGRHIDRTSAYVEILARQLQKSPVYAHYLTEDYISDIVKAAPLHDVGKVGVPDAILCKPGRLSEIERNAMQQHSEIGERLLREAERKIPFQSFLKIAIQLAGSHHERWDGAGYPRGLCGHDIPLSARIMAVADVYDALRTERPYKKAFDHETSTKIILSDRGKLFDPDIVEAFMLREKDFLGISLRLSDESVQVPERGFSVSSASLEQQAG